LGVSGEAAGVVKAFLAFSFLLLAFSRNWCFFLVCLLLEVANHFLPSSVVLDRILKKNLEINKEKEWQSDGEGK